MQEKTHEVVCFTAMLTQTQLEFLNRFIRIRERSPCVTNHVNEYINFTKLVFMVKIDMILAGVTQW